MANQFAKLKVSSFSHSWDILGLKIYMGHVTIAIPFQRRFVVGGPQWD